MANELRTFVFVCEGKILSPPLVTIREYAGWMEKYFDKFTCQLELYLPAKKSGGTVLEWHPGTKIGRFFDMQGFTNWEYVSWMLPVDTKGMEQLVRHGFAVKGDARKNLLRTYTIYQVELYLKSTIDSNFYLGDKIIQPVQIILTNKEAQRLVRPRLKNKRKLF